MTLPQGVHGESTHLVHHPKMGKEGVLLGCLGELFQRLDMLDPVGQVRGGRGRLRFGGGQGQSVVVWLTLLGGPEGCHRQPHLTTPLLLVHGHR